MDNLSDQIKDLLAIGMAIAASIFILSLGAIVIYWLWKVMEVLWG